jgi:hypothetical protein
MPIALIFGLENTLFAKTSVDGTGRISRDWPNEKPVLRKDVLLQSSFRFFSSGAHYFRSISMPTGTPCVSVLYTGEDSLSRFSSFRFSASGRSDMARSLKARIFICGDCGK